MAETLSRYSREDSIRIMNRFGSSGTPFLFLISYEGEQNCIIKSAGSERLGFHIEMPGFSNHQLVANSSVPVSMNKFPIGKERYRHAFDLVTSQILYGNSFLLNLTFPTEIQINCALEDIFTRSRAPFKLFLEDELVVFSPERFIRTDGNTITSYPMKGTIDAAIPGAHAKLSSDMKEDAEHNTIVDLIRNDLSTVATNVRVKRFKYIDRVRTHIGELLQMSSEITGSLPDDFQNRLGEMIFQLLPAGSICGAPKLKTLDIIREAEQYKRGYYTGVFGRWDGKCLDSAVAIRYIEKDGKHLFFKSGGGITFRSQCDLEYQEMLNKVYVPIY